MSVTDGTTLWLRSLWHEQAAALASSESASAISAILNPFRLPFEAHQAVEVSDDLSADWVFLSYYMSPADINFMTTVQSDGLAALESHAQHSLSRAFFHQQ